MFEGVDLIEATRCVPSVVDMLLIYMQYLEKACCFVFAFLAAFMDWFRKEVKHSARPAQSVSFALYVRSQITEQVVNCVDTYEEVAIMFVMHLRLTPVSSGPNKPSSLLGYPRQM